MIDLAQLAPGKVVRLISGSPKMAVVEVRDGRILCLWWSDRLGIVTDQFPPEVLTFPSAGPTLPPPRAEQGDPA